MFKSELSSIGTEDTKPDNKTRSRLGRIIGVGIMSAAALAAGEQARAMSPQDPSPSAGHVESERRYSDHFPVIFDSLAHGVMLKTGVMFRGTGLYLSHIKRNIDLVQNGSVIRVEVIAEGDRGLTVKIYKKPEVEGKAGKITEIKISNGFLQETPDQSKK